MCHNKAHPNECENPQKWSHTSFSNPKCYLYTTVGDDRFRRPIQTLIDSIVYGFYWQSSAFKFERQKGIFDSNCFLKLMLFRPSALSPSVQYCSSLVALLVLCANVVSRCRENKLCERERALNSVWRARSSRRRFSLFKTRPSSVNQETCKERPIFKLNFELTQFAN